MERSLLKAARSFSRRIIKPRSPPIFSTKVILKAILTSTFLIFIFSCSGSPSRMIHNSQPIKKFLDGTPYTHFASACRLYDLNGSLAAFVEGKFCAIEPDGSFYRRTNEALDYIGPDQKTLWRAPIKSSHHQISHSKVSGNFLAINNDFKEWNGKKTRFDVLLLLNRDGRIISRFSFYNFFKKHPEVLKQQAARKTVWFYGDTEPETDIHELTHANSFVELTRRNAEGKPTVVGYLSNCIYQSKFYIFDPTLSNIVKVIDLNDSSTHSITQIDNDDILYYRNSNPDNLLSSAEIYNLATNSFTTLYKSNNPYLSGAACSSVQLLSPEKLMLAHSQCFPSNNKADYGLAVEFVDLNKKESFYYLLQKTIPYTNSFLIDGKKFVEINPRL